MASGEMLDMLRGASWWRILKALAFEGGPSATKWVYLALNAVMALVVVALTAAVCIRYVHAGSTDAGMMALIGSLVAVLQACATNALNHRRTVQAQLASGRGPIAVAETPVTTEQPAAAEV